MADLNINVRIDSRALKGLLAGVLLAWAALELGSETLTLSTYYPAPSGVYDRMVTTGNTYLARDNNARVGIGTTAPLATLDIQGNLRLADGSQGAGKVLTSDDRGAAAWRTALSTGPALYRVTDNYCSSPGPGQMTTQSTCTTGGTGAVDTYRRCPCYYGCSGENYFTNSSGDVGCYNCGSPQTCPNTLMGYLIRP